MRKTIWTLLLLWVSSAIKGLQANQGDHMEMTRLKASLMYVRAIKTFRLLFMSLLGLGLCLVFLLVGLVLFHVSLFLYSPWSVGTKLSIGLLFSAIYLLATVVLFSKIFAPEKWLEIFHAHGIMEHLKTKPAPLQKDSQED